jgi:hypothetical protein
MRGEEFGEVQCQGRAITYDATSGARCFAKDNHQGRGGSYDGVSRLL